MTEKDYSGVTTNKIGKNAKTSPNSKSQLSVAESKKEKKDSKKGELQSSRNFEDYKKAGKIAEQVREYAKSIIKPGVLLVEIAEKTEAKILELGGQLGFPVNLSIDDVAAHYTPTLRDTKKAEGLLKVDLGVSINGCIADTAFSLDLTPEKKYSKLIQASEKALKKALDYVSKNKDNSIISEIGKEIHNEITSSGFAPIRNLSGHGLDEYTIHSGITIPNYENGNTKALGKGAFAIEPFATTGEGMIYEGQGSTIYHWAGDGQVRDQLAREILVFIIENKKTLPFSQREIEKKFGSKALFALATLKRVGIIQEYPQLIEKSHAPVSQTETSLTISDNVEVIVKI
jgi:methionyl aminopeptidase